MRICWAQYTLWAVIAVLGVVSMLAGCGSKGDLYLPEEIAARLKREKVESSLWKWDSRKYATTGASAATLESLRPLVEEAHDEFSPAGVTDEWLTARLEPMLGVVEQQPVALPLGSEGSEEEVETLSPFAAQRMLLALLGAMSDKLEPHTVGIDEADYTVTRYRLLAALSDRLEVIMAEAGNVVLTREQRKQAFDHYREQVESVAALPPASEARALAEKRLLQGMVAAVIQASKEQPAASQMTEQTATRLLGEQMVEQVEAAKVKIQEMALNGVPAEEIAESERRLAVKEALIALTGITAGRD